MMKFGQDLHRFQIAHWTPNYIDYSGLKAKYKGAAKSFQEQGRPVNFSDFTDALTNEEAKVVSFYQAQLDVIHRKEDTLFSEHNVRDWTSLAQANGLELTDILIGLTEIRTLLQQLQWYGFVNYEKILTKVAKFCNTSRTLGGWQDLSRSIVDVQSRYGHYLTLVTQRLIRTPKTEESPILTVLLPSLLQERYEIHHREHAEGAIHAIQADDVSMLKTTLEHATGKQALHQDDDHLSGNLVFGCIILKSRLCLEHLLHYTQFFSENSKHLARLIIRLGRISSAKLCGLEPVEDLVATIDLPRATEMLLHVIRRVSKHSRAGLFHRDPFGRLPLHYAVQYRLTAVCTCILEQMAHQGLPNEAIATAPALIEDEQAVSPLKLAVLARDAPLTEFLLRSLGGPLIDKSSLTELTVLSVKLGSFTILQLLLSSGINISLRYYNNESLLYVAVKYGWTQATATILDVIKEQAPAAIDLPEATREWTPLILACVKGDRSSMDLLLQHGADLGKKDKYGWIAKDHAAYRGWEPMALLLTSMEPCPSKGHRRPSLRDRSPGRRNIQRTLPLPTFARHSLDDVPVTMSQVYVTLGAIDTYQAGIAVDLSPHLSPMPYGPQDEANFVVEVGSLDEGQPRYITQLPVMENLSNEPLRFTTPDPNGLNLVFNIYPANASRKNNDSLIGSAIAMVGQLKHGLGAKRESLIRNFTIPILKRDTLAYIGSVTFYCLIVTPFPHIRTKPHHKQEINFGINGEPTVIGHRGTGQNDPSRRQLQIGENTIEESKFISFPIFSSHDHVVIPVGKGTGRFVYRDVQVTKDGIPIIYHDFLMSETGIDAPLHSLSFEQFMYISDAQSTPTDGPSMAEKRFMEKNGDQGITGSKPRANSLNLYEQSEAKTLVERMKHTFEYKLNAYKGFDSYKGNIRSAYIQAPFVTLEDLLRKLPECFSFDIEIKYPMLFEAHDWDMDTYALEANHVVDIVLETVYRLADKRTIFFSSFSPEICILLSRKQDVYPVYFLTESGHIPSADARADSLQEAIHFARNWKLPGIIARSQPLVMSPDLIQYVKDSGLQCISWGELNDEPQNAEGQINAGLDAIIVNSVKLIAQTIKDNESRKRNTESIDVLYEAQDTLK